MGGANNPRADTADVDDIAACSIVKAELFYGA